LPALQQLVLKAPNEFNIHFLLGKIYTLLRDPANATRSFAYALDIDPKMSGAIKAAQTAHLMEDGDDDGQDDGSQMTQGPGL
jgi:anaphase-promoting complex subunit 3